jgi:glycosyltransferase involved in cell wall biosynthesis
MKNFAHTPKISIITIVRNGLPFIRHTIHSVLTQSYKNIQYIVIDGASTDGTLEILKKYTPQEVIWTSEPDQGLYDAFNKGIELADGDYLLFLNSDDYLADVNVIDLVVKEISSNDFPMMAYSDCYILDRLTDRKLYRDVVTNFPKDILKGAILPHPSLFTRKDYFHKYGKFDVDFKIAGDFEWMLRGGPKERILYIPSIVTNIRNGGLSDNHNRALIINEIVLALKKNGYINSHIAELKVRAYFSLRSLSRSLLKFFGAYQIYNYLRKK